ncbi:myosin-2-like isoform X2 [Momordica charantia]|uniref:Myosin-2-like isoform X2 n=1 Tax=Momordica charantia TaxID=3673 RepID=A0A6J1BTQ2_MOMCH|nr:myosin-2-like isoform X2 [Momordica charantia]
MAVPKLATLTICIALIIFSASADVIVDGEGEDIIEVGREDGSDSSLLKIELEKLNSKIRELEVLIDEKTLELEKKDDLISQKDKIFRDKSNKISFLQSEIESLQREGKLHAEEKIGKAQARAGELEKQVSELKRELYAQNREKNALEERSSEAEKEMHKSITKLEKLQTTNKEQKSKIQKLERALKVAEEEMIKAKFEVTSKTEELMEVHGAWFPPWLASFWNEHVEPAMHLVMQKMWAGKAHVENCVGPHIEPIKAKWIPAMHERWVVVKTNSKPHLQSLCKRSSEAYEASKQALTSHIIKAQEFASPYFQVKSTIQEMLNSHDITRPIATKEFEWFLDSALLALPMIILFNLCRCCGISRKKARRPGRSANPTNARRRAKRGTSVK